ncbi:MAG: DUF4365 domain-containing protein [Xanthobacteraceae bacterium]
MTRSTPDPTTERKGINAVEGIFLNEFGWLFREQPVADYGIDALVEVIENNEPTGKLIALQIKTGDSYFRPKGNGYVFYGELRHLKYWTRHSLPVFLILHDPARNLTLWQKVERRVATVSEKGWSIVVPSANLLTAACKPFILEGIANDDESIRRINMAYDREMMERFEGREVYLEVNQWVNKSLSFRDVGVYYDDPGKEKPDFMIRRWIPSPTLDEYMRVMFPWLDYDFVESEETLGGEVEVHSLQVRLNDLGKSYLRLEEYFEYGLPERDETETSSAGPVPTDNEEDEAAWIRDAIERDKG